MSGGLIKYKNTDAVHSLGGGRERRKGAYKLGFLELEFQKRGLQGCDSIYI